MKKLTIGQKLKQLRGDRTQAQVAKELGISEAAVCAYENDQRVPRDRLKSQIASYFDTTVQDLFF